jgi:hypothetical protein
MRLTRINNHVCEIQGSERQQAVYEPVIYKIGHGAAHIHYTEI